MEELILASARHTLKVEIQTLEALHGVLDDLFYRAVVCLQETTGKIIVTGVGKSGIVAQKIVATFNSTGKQAVFIHAGDALHGDLGIIHENDTVLIISKSGESGEIKQLIPFIKNFGNTLIAMVGNKNSYLAQLADGILFTPIEKEADPNNLAPTASTTAQMVMGDMVALALLRLRGFTTEQFAKLHPGGALGKQLTLRVSHLYQRHAAPAVFLSATLREVILEISKNRLGATAVLDTEKNLVGIITDGDLRRMLQHTTNIEHIRAEQFMSRNPKTITPDTFAIEALRQMEDMRITQLIVTEAGTYVGMVHLHDIVREGII